MRKEKAKIFDDILFYFNEQEEEQEEEETPVEGTETSEEGTEAYQGSEEEYPVDETQPQEGYVDPEEQLSDVDKVYRLKKLYAKLLAVSKILDHYSDESFEDLQKKVLESIDIFHIIMSNYDVFKNKINPIIKSFERLLQTSVEEIEKLTKVNKEK